MVKLLLGIMLLGSGANILIFLLAGITKGKPPVIDEDAKLFQDVFADPIPQALILTAIVISFALTAFAIVLLNPSNPATFSLDNRYTLPFLPPVFTPTTSVISSPGFASDSLKI